MCDRFYINEKELPEITEAAKASPLSARFRDTLGKDLAVSGEIRPMDVVPVIAPDRSGKRAVYPMLWGFSLNGSRPVINARSETAPQKPMFKEAWSRHRCIIPASAYIEWEHLTDEKGRKLTGTKYLIRPEDAGSLTFLCGLYRIENALPCFVILTRPPTEKLSAIHDRMPLILPEKALDLWLDPSSSPDMVDGLKEMAVTGMDLAPFDAALT